MRQANRPGTSLPVSRWHLAIVRQEYATRTWKMVQEGAIQNTPVVKCWPDIDVVIPVLNCAEKLRRCLSSVHRQAYPGEIRIIVVDGGSVDATREVASAYGARVIVNTGQYATGRNGARHAGESAGSAPLVWLLDADNEVVGGTALLQLVTPLMSNSDVNLALPVTTLDEQAPSFNNWLSLVEVENVMAMVRGARSTQGVWQVDDMFYGVTNATLIRRQALVAAGGYDSDVRLLMRLRRLKLSTGVIVPSSQFYHNQVNGVLDFIRKWARRVSRFGRMKEADLRAYFVEYPIEPSDDANLRNSVIGGLLGLPLRSIRGYMHTRDTTWLWGVIYPIIIGLIFTLHPIYSRRVASRFL
jgi:glycosyltransferase involved in cell wall biosynthesis